LIPFRIVFFIIFVLPFNLGEGCIVLTFFLSFISEKAGRYRLELGTKNHWRGQKGFENNGMKYDMAWYRGQRGTFST